MYRLSRGKTEARKQPRGYFSSLWEEKMVAWVRVLSVKTEGNNFLLYFGERDSRTLLYMEKEGNKGTKDAPYDIGLTNQPNGSTFY